MADTTEETGRPQDQSFDDAVKQATHDALSPTDKHKNYLADLERLHNESKVNESGRTVA